MGVYEAGQEPAPLEVDALCVFGNTAMVRGHAAYGFTSDLNCGIINYLAVADENVAVCEYGSFHDFDAFMDSCGCVLSTMERRQVTVYLIDKKPLSFYCC